MLSGQPAYDREVCSKEMVDDTESLFSQIWVAERTEMIG